MLTYFIRFIITLAFKRQKEAENSEDHMTLIFDSLPDAILLVSELEPKKDDSSVSAELVKNDTHTSVYNRKNKSDRSHLYRSGTNPFPPAV